MYIRIIAINKMTKCIPNYVFNWCIIFKSKDSFPELYTSGLEDSYTLLQPLQMEERETNSLQTPIAHN